MTPTWRDVNVAIRDRDAPFGGLTKLLFAAERGLDLPLEEGDALDMMLGLNRADPITDFDDAIAWTERLIPGARLQFWNQSAGGGWCATVTCRAEGVEAQATALTLPFALIKATVEAKVDLEFLSAPDPS
jgi:hypothetical protein